MWVRSKYTAELAVLTAWLAVLLPWNVVYYTRAPLDSTVIFLRFAFFEIQLRYPTEFDIEGFVVDASEPLALTYPGTNLAGNIFITTPPTSAMFYDGTLELASIAWTVGAVIFGLAFLLSLALYFRTDATLSRLPASEVRIMGGLLGLATIATGVASVLYALESGTAGTPVPVGVVIVGLLAIVLLRTEKLPADEAADQTASDDTANGS